MKVVTWIAAALLPAAAAEAQTAFGLGEAHTLESKVLGEKRAVYVHAPPGCEAGGASRCAVLYTLDGEAQFAHTVTTAGFLHRNDLVPPLIVVGIGNTDRTRDLTPTAGGHVRGGRREVVPGTGGGEKFLDFVERELLPWVDGRYPTHPMRVLAGHSFGGHTVLHALSTRPHLFRGWIAVAPTLLWNDGEPIRAVRRFVESQERLAHAVYVATAAEGLEMERATGELRRALKSRSPEGFRFEVQHFGEDDHGSVVLPAHLHGLRFVFDGWALPRDRRTGALTVFTYEGVRKHYAGLSERFGFEAKAPEAVLNMLGYRSLAAGDTRDALRWLELAVEQYPASANAHDSLGEALEASGRLEDARRHYATAVERGRARRDPNLPAYESHLAALERKLARP